MKVEVVNYKQTDEISLKHGDVCLLRCGGVVMVRNSEDGTDEPFYTGDEDNWYLQSGTYLGAGTDHCLDIIRVLGNGQAFYDAVRVKVEVPGV